MGVFVFSMIVIVFIISAGYIIVSDRFGDKLDDSIKSIKDGEETFKDALIGAKFNVVFVSILLIIASISYIFIVPNVRNANLDISISIHRINPTEIQLDYNVKNNGIHPIWVAITTVSTLKINITDSQGKSIVYGVYGDDFGNPDKLYCKQARSGLYDIDAIEYSQLQYYLANDVYFGLNFCASNSTPPYSISLMYDTEHVTIPSYIPVWRGIVQSNIIELDSFS